MNPRRAFYAGLAALATLSAAQAVVIGFDAVVGGEFDPYFGHVEQGFQVEPVVGDWMFVPPDGNPYPCVGGSLFKADYILEVSIRRVDGGLFALNSSWFSFDHRGDYRFEGFLDGALQYTYRHPMALARDTRPCPFATPVDFATITLYDNDAQYRNVDSINVTPVPEPAATTVLVIAAGCLALRRRPGEGI